MPKPNRVPVADGGSNPYQFPNAATPPGSSAYYSIRFGARRSRSELALLFAWRAEIIRTRREARDPGVARLKLDWWRRELEASRAGTARHPLAHAMTTPFALHQLPLEPFLQLLDATESDILKASYADADELRQHCLASGGSFLELLTRVAGTPDTQALDQARELGAFVRLVEIISRLGADLRLGHCYLPLALLDRHDLSVSTLSTTTAPSGLASMLGELAAEARNRHQGPVRRQDNPALGPAMNLAALSRAGLDELERNGFPVLNSRVSLTPLRKLWIAWRSGRQIRQR